MPLTNPDHTFHQCKPYARVIIITTLQSFRFVPLRRSCRVCPRRRRLPRVLESDLDDLGSLGCTQVAWGRACLAPRLHIVNAIYQHVGATSKSSNKLTRCVPEIHNQPHEDRRKGKEVQEIRRIVLYPIGTRHCGVIKRQCRYPHKGTILRKGTTIIRVSITFPSAK